MLVSVIIPTFDRNERLARCLERLTPGAQTIAPGEYEVIVADDGFCSTAEEMVRRTYSFARWVPGPRRGPAANRNHGARHALGDWLAFVDDDCLPDSGWLQAIADAAAGPPLDVVEGRTVTPDKVDHPFRLGVENLHGGVYWSCNLAIRREVFQEMGGFDEDFLEAGGEDMEFAFRIREKNLRTRFVEAALVLHPVRNLTWHGLLWRTRLNRWMSLYHLKTGGGLPLSANRPQIACWFVVRAFSTLLRTTWHSMRKLDRTAWRSQAFWQLWQWVSFPFVLPYLLIWELRFRQRLAARTATRRGAAIG